MKLNKLTRRSLVTEEDIEYNYRLGIPVEVYCLYTESTVAFGKIASFTSRHICISKTYFNRNHFVFIGQRIMNESKSSLV
ncbi:hypothetical protein [Alteribacillus sp. HJP-4]|uniref:hypothetical protein n=1 Tax=Alteribacillus sp. HJP-4 TaxID=2775394 RepID=UPI0035CCDDEE